MVATSLQPRFVTRDAFTVVGLQIRVRPMTPEIPQLWQRFAPRIDEVPHMAEAYTSYGVMDHFDAQAQRIDYLAGVSVSTLSAALPEGMVQLTIPRAEYAVFDAALASLGEVFGFIYGQWLPGATMRQAAGPYFERYGPAFDPANPNSPIEIFIPLERAA